jgi:hypothetical protein
VRKLAVLAVGTILAGLLAAPAGAQECQDLGTGSEFTCCDYGADKINSISRKLTGSDLILCTQ